ncbi:hypothetical protein MHB42_14805 [Lysinibacillus sp. FSL K6-0232]|uniref:hypothetical protein n=1 Tax=Lysinibacillus sp. FSL K6-0232 TaxID=2921425 RepID=UPI0030FCB5F1
MLKQLLEGRIVTLNCKEMPFQPHVYKMQNGVEVLGIEAKSLQIENDKIVAGYIVDQSVFFKSLHFGQTNIIFSDGDNKAIAQLFVRPSGEIIVEVKPYLGKTEIIPVYYRTILADTAIAIDLKGALKHYLVARHLMKEEDAITEVHYQSMHPNVLKDSFAGNFVLGCHVDGRALQNAEEYALANRQASLKFSKIVIQQQGTRKVIAFHKLLTFMITNHVFMSYEHIPEYVSNNEKSPYQQDRLRLV